MNDSSERALLTNPTFPALLLLVLCAFVLPRVLGFGLALLSELLLLLLECGEEVYREGRRAREIWRDAFSDFGAVEEAL